MINRRSYLGIPMARRRNRRWLVAGYWASVVAILGFASAAIHQTGFSISPKNWWMPFLIGLLIGTSLVFLGGSAQIGPVADFDGDTTPPSRWILVEMVDTLIRRLTDNHSENRVDSAMDERDVRLRNAAHFEAYRLLRSALIPLGIAAVFVFQFVLKGYAFLSIPIYCLLILLIYNLPQTLILWWEPDIEELQ